MMIPPHGCPACHSSEIEACVPETSDDLHVLSQECDCRSCGAKWTEYFHYVSYERITS